MNTAPQVTAPNATFADDTEAQILTRVLARIAAKGAGVQGVYTEGWQASSRERTIAVRSWSIAVTDRTGTDNELLDAPVLGEVIVTEIRERVLHAVRGIAPANQNITSRVRFTIGLLDDAASPASALRNRLGWRA